MPGKGKGLSPTLTRLGSLLNLMPSIGDICVWNANQQKRQFIKTADYNAETLPDYITPFGVCFAIENDKALVVSKDDQAAQIAWAAPFKAKLQGFDFTTGGSFIIRITSWDAVNTNTSAINYTTSDNLTTVAALISTAMNAGANNSELKNWVASADITNNCIILVRNWYSPKISNVTPIDADSKVTATVLCIDKQSELSGLGATVVYPIMIRNDGGVDYSAGLNFEKFYSYLYTNGGTEINQSVGASTIIRYSRFNITDNPNLVAYYGAGTDGYALYIQDKMIKYPFPENTLITADGKYNTSLLSAVTFVDVDGVTKRVYPAAYSAIDFGISIDGQITGLEAGGWWLPSVHEMYFLIKDRKSDGTDAVNLALTKIGGTKLNNANIAYWTSNEAATGSGAYQNYGSSGRYSALSKYVTLNGSIPNHVRAITVF